MHEKQKARWLWIAGGLVSLALWKNRRLFTVNDVTTGQSKDYPDLKPRAYPFDPAQIFALVEATARDMARWRVVAVDRLGCEVQAEVETPIFGFFDDVTIRVDLIPGSSVSEVVVRSRSRTGIADLGENARHIRAFYKSLDDRVRNASDANAAPIPAP